jgi:hypothetical protein
VAGEAGVGTALLSWVGSVSALVLANFRDDELDRAQQLRIVLGELGGRLDWLKGGTAVAADGG